MNMEHMGGSEIDRDDEGSSYEIDRGDQKPVDRRELYDPGEPQLEIVPTTVPGHDLPPGALIPDIENYIRKAPPAGEWTPSDENDEKDGNDKFPPLRQ